jgi:Flp pilus assembly protein TadD
VIFETPRSDLLLLDAIVAHSAGRDADAVRLLEEALRADPAHPGAMTALAEIQLVHRNQDRATELLDAALAIEPHFAPAWSQLSIACWLNRRYDDSLAAARRAVEIQPPNPKFRLKLAQTAAWLGLFEEARLALAPLLAKPDGATDAYGLALGMAGELAIAEGRFPEADSLLEQALRALPEASHLRMLRGMNQLRLGRFRDGWANYAARENVPFLYPDGPPVLPGAAWTGQDLRRKAILVADDQGHGDSVQMVRYLPMLRQRGAERVILRTFTPLRRLLADSAPDIDVTDSVPDDAGIDYHCSSTALPRWFGTVLGDIPWPGPYLRPPARPGPHLKPPSGRRPKVGIAWSGDTRHTRDHLRSVPAGAFLRLADLPGISFHSLQHEIRPADLPALEARPEISRAVERARDFADTAALIAKLDLVVTVDTAVAHVAAAMGKPVWIVLHIAPDWRWLTERADSPWYPTVRLFRMAPTDWTERDRGWPAVIDRVAAALRDFARR